MTRPRSCAPPPNQSVPEMDWGGESGATGSGKLDGGQEVGEHESGEAFFTTVSASIAPGI